jgi:3-oxoacyl-[acyl-carrier protein] reductase
MDLGGRVAIVTGAGRGLGEAIARALHARGASVVLADIDLESAERVAAELGDRARGVACDVRNREDLARVVDAVDRLDVMVNNAARTVPRSFWEIEQEEWDDVLAVNLRGVVFGCQLAGARMREQGSGRIVNLASISGQTPGAMGAHYAASKAGIVIVTKIVATELAPHGITCNAVAPAAVRTPAFGLLSEERLEALRQRIPVGRFGEPWEVAELVCFLCSDAAGYVTGATYDVNGGLLMR